MASPPLVDLDVFGQRLFWRHLHVRRPVVPLAHSCVRMTWYLEWQRVLLFPDIFALNWAQWRRIKSFVPALGLETEPVVLLMFSYFTRTLLLSASRT